MANLKLKRGFTYVVRVEGTNELINKTKNFFTCEQYGIEYLEQNKDATLVISTAIITEEKRMVEIDGQMVKCPLPIIRYEKAFERLMVKTNDLDVEYIDAERIE